MASIYWPIFWNLLGTGVSNIDFLISDAILLLLNAKKANDRTQDKLDSERHSTSMNTV